MLRNLVHAGAVEVEQSLAEWQENNNVADGCKLLFSFAFKNLDITQQRMHT